MKRKNEPQVRETMEKLEPLDLSKCHTVSEIVDGMSRCSFGARMLGEVADTLTRWVTQRQQNPRVNKPHIIYDGDQDTSLGKFLGELSYLTDSTAVSQEWFYGPTRTSEFWSSGFPSTRLIVIGNFSEKWETRFFESVSQNRGEIIFINQYGKAKPRQIRDGFFPNVVFADPNLIIPILFATLRERTEASKKTSVSALFTQLEKFSGVAQEVVAGGETLLAMVNDRECTNCLTLAGAMTIAKMQLLVCDMIDQGMVDYIASTGALMAHGLIEGIGDAHYKYNPAHSDKLLAAQAINRVTDTLEPEENFEHLDEVMNAVLGSFSGNRPISPSMIHKAIGAYLKKHHPTCRGILRSAYEKGVPVCVPAFHDSEIGNDVFVHNLLRAKAGKPPLIINQEIDTQLLVDYAVRAKRLGIFSIGGGVPRNNTQNVAPLIEIARNRKVAQWPMRKFRYGCRIDPTPLWYGNLSGCTYSEGGSWRKMDLEHGRFAEIHADATIVWPFILKYVMENLES